MRRRKTPLKLKYFSRCFLLFISWHSLFLGDENVFRMDASSSLFCRFLWSTMVCEREIYIYTPVEYKCWYHSIYSRSLWFKYTKYLILTPTLFDKTNIPYNRFRCVKLAMRVFVSEFTIFSRKTFISPSSDRKKTQLL